MERELSPRAQFLRQMAAAQDAQLRQGFGVAQQKALLRKRLGERRERRLAPWAALGAALVAAGVVLFWPSPLTFAVGSAKTRGEIGAAVASPETSPVDLTFSDGSFLALGPQSRARVTNVDSHGAAIVVERGHADVSIVPRKNGSWRLDAGPFEIHVKGTRFSFDWDPSLESLDFHLHHGAVVITAACLPGGRALVAGESLQASCRPTTAGLASASATPSSMAQVLPAPAQAPSSAPSTAASAAPSAGAQASPSWQKLASAQDYRGALNAVVRLGFDDECSRASSADLLLLGDVARLAGDPGRALVAYAAARRKHEPTDRSAFALGLVEFDQRGHYARAAQWFATYLKEQPHGPLVEEAQGRLMEAWQRAGDASNAGTVAQAYLSRYPRGQYADLARRLAQAE